MRGGLNPKDKELKEKGFLTINDLSKLLNKGRCTITTALSYLYIKPSEIIGKHLFYSSDIKTILEDFYRNHADYEKFLAKEMRKRKYGGNGYEGRDTKTKQTLIERYGENYKQVIVQKMKKSIKQKYGDENYRNWDKVKQTRNANIQKFCEINSCSAFSEIFGTRIEHSWETLSYCMAQNSIQLLTYKNTLYIKNEDVNKLKQALSMVKDVKFSVGEKELFNFVKSLGLEAEANNRSILNGKELDIYIPSKKIAIEFDGLRWHSTQFQENKNYHLEKTIACENPGIRLIHVFEDEWLTQRPIVESIIRSAVGIYDQRIYARKCIVKNISADIFRVFCNENHIQGYCSSSIRLGLFYENTLVQAVGFSKSRFSKDCQWELTRMCTKLNTQIVGGFSKLMKHFGQDCISYIDRRLFDGRGYRASNFKTIGVNPPSFYYTKGISRFYRMNFTKQNIAKKFPESYDATLTEEENMIKLGFHRIYDCGTVKVLYPSKGDN